MKGNYQKSGLREEDRSLKDLFLREALAKVIFVEDNTIKVKNLCSLAGGSFSRTNSFMRGPFPIQTPAPTLTPTPTRNL